MARMQINRGADKHRPNECIISSPALSSLAEWWAAVVNGKTITEATDTFRETIEEIWILDGVQLPLLNS